MSRPAGKKRVLIVDDHPLFREGLKSLINRSTAYAAVGEAGSAEEALDLTRRLQPELVTMDISLPGQSGLDATGALCRQTPSLKLLIVSMHLSFDYIAAAFRAGARGYLVKEATSSKLIEALDCLDRGEHYLDGGVSAEIIARIMREADAPQNDTDAGYSRLSAREQQVMRLIVEGHSTRAIAAELQLSPKTIDNHRTNLMKKLGVHNRMELIRYAVKLGLIDPEEWRD